MLFNNNLLERMNNNKAKEIHKSEVDLPPSLKFHFQDPLITERLSYCFYKKLTSLDPKLNRPIIILCIGTDRSTGDCLGPLVGTKLTDTKIKLNVYGTLDEPVHATNLEEKISYINKNYKNPLIIAIDACLGRTENIGYITLNNGAIKPGSAVKKNLPEIGHLNFTGIVNIGGYMEYLVLQNTRLNIVWAMASKIKESIVTGYSMFEKYHLDSFKADSDLLLQ